MMTIREASERLKIPQNSVHRWAKANGYLIRVGGGAPGYWMRGLPDNFVEKCAAGYRLQKIAPGYGTFGMRWLALTRRERHQPGAFPS